MSITHDFILCDLPVDSGFDELLVFYRNNKRNAIQVDDRWISKYWPDFEHIPSYWQGVYELEEGLNYHGFSLIPSERIPELLNIINVFPRSVLFKRLYRVCICAIEQNKGILHMGV